MVGYKDLEGNTAKPGGVACTENTYPIRMSDELDEPLLIHSAQHGDLEAFNLLIERHQNMLFRIALRMLGDDDRAADATQEAWISAFRQICKFRGSNLRPWLTRVVVNICYDEIRRQWRRREVSLQRFNPEEEEMETTLCLADPAPGVEESVDIDEFEKILDEYLQSLIPIYRTMLVLIDIEGLTYEEAASVERVPLGTVRSRLARARMALQQHLRETADLLPARYCLQVPLSEQAK